MLLHDEAVGEILDRYMLERFMNAAEVTAKKLRMYAAQAEGSEVRRHLSLMAEANENAKTQLEGLVQHL